MYRDTRREYIVRLLRNKDECSVSDLANYFFCYQRDDSDRFSVVAKAWCSESSSWRRLIEKTFNAKCAFATRVCRYEFAYQATTAGYWLFNLA